MYVYSVQSHEDGRNHQANSKHIFRREEIQKLSLVGSQHSMLGRWRERYKGAWEGRRRRPQRGVVLPKSKEGSASGTAEGPLSPKAPTGPRSRCKARPASFPVPSSSSSFPPRLLSFRWFLLTVCVSVPCGWWEYGWWEDNKRVPNLKLSSRKTSSECAPQSKQCRYIVGPVWEKVPDPGDLSGNSGHFYLQPFRSKVVLGVSPLLQIWKNKEIRQLNSMSDSWLDFVWKK